MTHLVWTAFGFTQCFSRDGTRTYRLCSDDQRESCALKGVCRLVGDQVDDEFGLSCFQNCRPVAHVLRELTPDEQRILGVARVRLASPGGRPRKNTNKKRCQEKS